MEEEIYKINNLTVNEQKTQFCLSYNNGLKIFDAENFQEISNSEGFEYDLGDVSLSLILPAENILMFVGSKKNNDYPRNKLVFIDVNNKKIISTETFDKDITNIKLVFNYLFICLGNDLKVYYMDKMYKLKQKDDYILDDQYKNIFEVWQTKEKYEEKIRIYLAYPYKNEIILSYKNPNDWELVEKININSPVSKIQNLFFIPKLNQIFISDENSIYIYGFDVEDGSTKVCLRRGTNPGYITSMTLINNNFLAVNNLNRTIHIFDLDINNNAFSFSNIVYGIFSKIKEIYPCLRIRYTDIIEEKEGDFYQHDFTSKGAVLLSNEEEKDLTVIAYNGYAYKIRIDFKENKFETVLKEKYAKKKDSIVKDGKISKLSLFKSINNFA